MAQLTTQEMIDRLRIKHNGATVRLEVDITTKVDFDKVSHDTHAWLTVGEKLTLIGGNETPDGVHLMVIINTDEPGLQLAERLTRHLIQEYGAQVVTEWFQLQEIDAIEVWNKTIDTAEAAWSINSKGGEG